MDGLLGGLSLGNSAWLAPAIIAVLVALIAVSAVYARSGASPFVNRVCGASKTLAWLLLAVCTLDPLLSTPRVRSGENVFVVLVDDSRSMAIVDGDLGSRASQVEQCLKRPWIDRLAQDFEVRRYAFDRQPRPLADGAPLGAVGAESAASRALASIRSRWQNRPVAGILLFSDGHVTDGEPDAAALKAGPPVYTVPIGSPVNRPDLALSNVVATNSLFEDAPTSIAVELSLAGADRAEAVVRLIDDEGRLVEAKSASVSSTAPTAAQFRFRPARTGVSAYAVRVDFADQADAIPPADWLRNSPGGTMLVPGDALGDNNVRRVLVERGAGPRRVLYVSGRPNWEYKAIRRSLELDSEVEVTALIRIAKKEPKFEWRGRSGESANPLFRGFDRVDDATEQYDQPVVVRLNTKSPDELREGFPRVAKELFAFSGLIIDDVEAAFFSVEQQQLIERFVSERGGGLLLLGGAESFAPGAPQRTSLGRMSPVVPVAASEVGLRGPFRLELTREGWLQPWMRLRSSEDAERVRLTEMPVFETFHATSRIKPGALVAANIRTSDDKTFPAVAVQRYGQGRCAAVLIGDLWRWGLKRTDAQRPADDPGRAWRQLLRSVIADVPDRIEAVVRSEAAAAGAVPLEVDVRTVDFLPDDAAAVSAVVTFPDGSKSTIAAEPSLDVAGRYEAAFLARGDGVYRVETSSATLDAPTASTDAANVESPQVSQTAWIAQPDPRELPGASPNTARLQRIARESGGELVPVDQLDELVRRLPSKAAPVMDRRVSPAWHNPWMLAMLAAALCTEWGLRRWKGLP